MADFRLIYGVVLDLAGTCKEKTGVGALLTAQGTAVTVYFRKRGALYSDVVSRAATIVSAASGTVKYTVTADDFARVFLPGTSWDVWWVATPAPVSSVGRYPNDSYLQLDVTA